jgi:hypothetical protein
MRMAVGIIKGSGAAPLNFNQPEAVYSVRAGALGYYLWGSVRR